MMYSFSSDFNMKSGAKTIIGLEKMNKGLQWSNIGLKYKGYSIVYSILSSLIWSIVFACLALYIEQVRPKDFGMVAPLNFLCKKK
jgi:hypothetical protein